MLLIALAALAPWAVSAKAATFDCEQKSDISWDGHYSPHRAEELGLPNDRQYCRRVVMNGPISASDVAAFNDWLHREPYTRVVRAQSTGGEVDAAMAIGRIVRSRFMTVDTEVYDLARSRECTTQRVLARGQKYGLPTDAASINQAVTICRKRNDCRVENRCCLSACVLVAVASVQLSSSNLGLHRLSLRDFAKFGYEEATRRLADANVRVEGYLKEMGVAPTLYAAMIKVPPDEIQLLDEPAIKALLLGISRKEAEDLPPDLDIMPASVEDWLKAKCKEQFDIDEYIRKRGGFQSKRFEALRFDSGSKCMNRELDREFVRRAKQTVQ